MPITSSTAWSTVLKPAATAFLSVTLFNFLPVYWLTPVSYAAFSFMLPALGMLTHKSRGKLKSVVFLFIGSTLATMIVSVRSGASWAPPPRPNNRTLMRPEPSPFNRLGSTSFFMAFAVPAPPLKALLSLKKPCAKNNPPPMRKIATVAIAPRVAYRLNAAIFAFLRIDPVLRSGLSSPGNSMSMPGMRRRTAACCAASLIWGVGACSVTACAGCSPIASR